MRPIDVMSNSYTECNVDYNARNAKFEIDGHARISKCKKCFAKDNAPSWSEEVFVINKVEDTVPQTHVIHDLNSEETGETFYEKELRKQIKQNLEL